MNSFVLHWMVLILLGLVFFTYCGYGILLYLITRKRTAPLIEADYTPRVSLIISAHNEEKSLGEKIENALAIDYPRDRLEIIVSSDGSTDNTVAIAESFAAKGVRVFAYPGHRGKTACLNDSIPKTSGDAIIMTDANALIDPAAVKNLVLHFRDSQVSLVCGKLKYRDQNNRATGEGLYKRYENWVRGLESRLGSLVSAEGSFFAIRRPLFTPIPPRFGEDVFFVYEALKAGKRSVYEDKAVSEESFALDTGRQILRRGRIVARNLAMLKANLSLLSPARGWTAFQLWSHKVLRWVSPFLLVAVFLATAALAPGHIPYRFLLTAQILCLLAALLYIEGERHPVRNSKIFQIPHFFVISNLGIFYGFLIFLSGKTPSTWKVYRPQLSDS